MADMSFRAKAVRAEYGYHSQIEVEVEDVDTDELLSEIGVEAVIRFFGEGELLDKIGKDEAIDHFDLESHFEQIFTSPVRRK